jgi:hypothetical protein
MVIRCVQFLQVLRELGVELVERLVDDLYHQILTQIYVSRPRLMLSSR